MNDIIWSAIFAITFFFGPFTWISDKVLSIVAKTYSANQMGLPAMIVYMLSMIYQIYFWFSYFCVIPKII